jgi:hypothetical protein
MTHRALELSRNHRGLELRVGEIEFFFDHVILLLTRESGSSPA